MSMLVCFFEKEIAMKTRKILIVVAVVALLSVPAFAQEEPFMGLVPMTVEGLCIAVPNLPVAAVAVVSRPHEVVAGGVQGVCIAGNTLIQTADMLANGCAKGLYVAGTNLDGAVVALLPQNILGTVGGGVELLFNGTDAIFKCVFGP